MERYRAPWWLPGGHAQTIWPALFSQRHKGAPLRFERERWDTPDDDFIDVDFLAGAPDDAPLLVLFHGLEGSSRSHYAQSFGHWAREAGWRYAVPHFRGCSGAMNLAPRAYHSGDYEEIGWILGRLQERCRASASRVAASKLYAVGVSLGGNALLRWAAEAGDAASAAVHAVAAISSPIDLAAGGRAIGQGVNRLIYTPMFLSSMKPKALAKLEQHPGLADRERVLAAQNLYDFDNAFTAPVHGFRDTDDYWRRSSAMPHLPRIVVPALLLNALNDPFLPRRYLPRAHQVGRHVTLWQPAHGGHVGFPSGSFPGHLLNLPDAVMEWMRSQT